MTPQLELFLTLDDYLDRRVISKDEFLKNHQTILPNINSVYRVAFDKLSNLQKNTDPNDIGRNWHAVNFNGFVKGQLIENFPEYFHEYLGTFCLRLEDVEIRFKKLSEKKMPKYNYTKSATLAVNQKYDQSSQNDRPIIYIGYTSDEAFSTITGIYAVRTSGVTTKAWSAPIHQMAKQVQAVTSSIPEKSETRLTSPAITVKLKKA